MTEFNPVGCEAFLKRVEIERRGFHRDSDGLHTEVRTVFIILGVVAPFWAAMDRSWFKPSAVRSFWEFLGNGKIKKRCCPMRPLQPNCCHCALVCHEVLVDYRGQM